ncbi:MAG: hypothetical protein ACHRHE_06845 [Tepidisphaerales bacterium]
MRKPLVERAGNDTLGKLEAAALSRMREAEALYSAGQRLGAVYLYGYVIEISLKAACYRIIGLVPGTVIDRKLHRRPAEDAIENMKTLPTHPHGGLLPGHNFVGWARLVEQERASPARGLAPLNGSLTKQLCNWTQNAFDCWAEFLRYRANRPYNHEVQTMRNSAQWIRRNYRNLWS